MYSEIVRLRADVGTWQSNAREANRKTSEEKLKRKATEKRNKELEEAI
jgi:hypothetical protein